MYLPPLSHSEILLRTQLTALSDQVTLTLPFPFCFIYYTPVPHNWSKIHVFVKKPFLAPPAESNICSTA